MSRQQKSVYVPECAEAIWDRAMDQALETSRGIGYVLLEAWAEKNGVRMPEYLNKGQITRLKNKNRRKK